MKNWQLQGSQSVIQVFRELVAILFRDRVWVLSSTCFKSLFATHC